MCAIRAFRVAVADIPTCPTRGSGQVHDNDYRTRDIATNRLLVRHRDYREGRYAFDPSYAETTKG